MDQIQSLKKLLPNVIKLSYLYHDASIKIKIKVLKMLKSYLEEINKLFF